MSAKFGLVTFGSLLVLFSFSAAGQVRADYLIDRSGTLVEVESIAMLYGSPVTVAEVGDYIDPLPVEGIDGETPPVLDGKGPAAKSRNQQTLEEREKFKKQFEAQVEAREKKLNANKQQIRSRIESVDGEVMVTQTTRNQEGKTVKEDKVTVPKQEKLYVEKQNGQALEITAAPDNSLELNSGGEPTRTRTHFPVGISQDGTLTITHKDGTSKEVAVLPDAALKNLEAKGFVPSSEVELTIEADRPVYRGEASKTRHLLGIKHPAFELKLDRFAVKIDALSGTVDESAGNLTAWQKILDRLSF